MTEHQSQMTPEFRERLENYLVAQDQRRADDALAMFAKLTAREQLLVREAAVMGFVQGSMTAGGIKRESFPKDVAILTSVLIGARSHEDLYPTLAALEGDVETEH